MVKVYAVTLAVGLVGIVVVVLGGSLAENLGRHERAPGHLMGMSGRMVIAFLVGFGMGGMSAEFAPLDLSAGVSFILAIVGGTAAAMWVRFAPQGNGKG